MIRKVYRSSSKEPVFVVITQLNLNFLDGFSKNNFISNFINIRQVGADFIRGADGGSDGRAGRNIYEFKRHVLQFWERANKKRLLKLSGFGDY